MKIEINFWVLFVLAIFITVIMIAIPEKITLFPFGIMLGVLVIAVSYLLRKSIVYDTKKRKIERLK